jgi:hypothetical protein
MNRIRTISNYVRAGAHAIVGCDQREAIESLVATVKADAAELPMSVVSLDLASTEREIAHLIWNGCANLAEQVGALAPESELPIDSCLADTMTRFSAEACQGVLFITGFDRAVRVQQLYTIEGMLRSVMQRANDVVVVLCCSHEVSLEICGPERPFYLSFRRFRIDRPEAHPDR